MALKIHIHPVSRLGYLPMEKITGILTLEGAEDPYGLFFTTPEGETHVFVLDATGKEGLIKHLTGVIVPTLERVH